MQRVKAGDHEAFSVVLGTHWGPLVLYAEGLLGDLDGAYDAVQEAFIRLWQGRRDWKPTGSVRVWLFRTVRNLCISQQRKRSVRTRWASGEGRTIGSAQATPLEETEQAEVRAAVRKAVEALSPRRREAFTLFYLRDLSYQDVAEVMGVREQTVANYLQAALAELRPALRERFRGQDPDCGSAETYDPDEHE